MRPGTGWFTVEQLEADTFAISEYRHWEETHCYLLLGTNAALLIDAGLGVADIREAVDSLTSLPLLAALTHAHWDHIGSLGSFDRVAVHSAERDWLSGRFPLPLSLVKRNLTARPCTFPPSFALERYQLYQGGATDTLAGGQVISLGGREVLVLHTPGHSPGHCCFYEPERKTLYSGDLIYSGCLDAFYPTTDPEQFFRSVRDMAALEVERVRPGHHRLDLPADLIRRVASAFETLSGAGKLKQGAGVFDFGAFQIHL